MNRTIIGFLGKLIILVGLSMVVPLLMSVYDNEHIMDVYLTSIAVTLACGGLCLGIGHGAKSLLRIRDGFLLVTLAWLSASFFGTMPMFMSGYFPNYLDAFFETLSGFTATGITVLAEVESLPRSILLWRSMTQWLGGMGIVVLFVAMLSGVSGSTQLLNAEVTGPVKEKLSPRSSDTAKILYLIYGVLTVIELAALIIAGMSPYDAAIHAMGTAGTGGFSNYGSSIGAFDSAVIDAIITFFMVLFGINFALFYRVLVGGWRDALRSEELHWYLALFAGSTLFVSLMILPQYGTFLNALRYGSFQVATIMSTTGYATADFNLWPQAVKALIVVLMFIGSCAGSTAGGIKVVRVGILCKLGCREVRRTFQPRKVQVVRFEGKGVEENRLTQVSAFFFVYVLLVLVGMFLVSLEGLYDLETNFTAVLTCISNVGPGLGHVGPVENFSGYGPFAKVVLSLLMLAGRLELFPILVLFHPSAWRKG